MSPYICFPLNRGSFLQEARGICVPIFYPVEVPPLGPGDPYTQLKTLGTIVRLAGALSEEIPMRRELNDIAQRALETTVDGLAEGVELVDLANNPAQGT